MPAPGFKSSYAIAHLCDIGQGVKLLCASAYSSTEWDYED